jgi:cholesterol transport system auxiliary component
MTTSARPLFLLFGLLLACSGCTLWPEAPDPPALHDFGPYSSGQHDFPWSGVIVSGPEWLEDTGIDYRLLYANPTERRSYTRDRWVAAPALLLQQRLNRGERPGSPLLRIELEDFEQVFDRPGQARVVMALKAAIEYPAASGDKPVEKAFRFESPTASADAAGALQAFPMLIRQAEGALSDWVRQQAVSRGSAVSPVPLPP